MARSTNPNLKRIDVLIVPELAAAVEADMQARGEKITEYVTQALAKRAKVKASTPTRGYPKGRPREKGKVSK